jgi:hypothetical protein
MTARRSLAVLIACVVPLMIARSSCGSDGDGPVEGMPATEPPSPVEVTTGSEIGTSSTMTPRSTTSTSSSSVSTTTTTAATTTNSGATTTTPPPPTAASTTTPASTTTTAEPPPPTTSSTTVESGGPTSTSTTEPVQTADNYAAGLDFLRTGIAYSSGDGTSDCFRGYDLVAPVPGVRLYLAEPADGLDIVTACHIRADDGSSGFEGELELLDPIGRVWTSASLRTAPGSYAFRANAATEVTASTLETLIEHRWYPIGRTFVEAGYRYTVVYLAIPIERLAGPWSVEIDGIVGTSSTIHACTVSEQVVRPWIVDFELAYVPVDQPANEELGRVRNNCRVQIDLTGLPLADAVDLIRNALAVVGINDPQVRVSGDCTEVGPPTVQFSAPAPGDEIRSHTSITVGAACPALPDVVGLTYGQAVGAVHSVWPAGIELDVHSNYCDSDTNVVRNVYPTAGTPSAYVFLDCYQ